MSIRMRFMLLVGGRRRKDDERVEVVVDYTNATELAYDIVCVERLHSPGSRASDTDRKESVETSPIFRHVKEWTLNTTVVILGAKEEGEEEIPEYLLRDSVLPLFAANLRCWQDRNEDRARREAEISGNKN